MPLTLYAGPMKMGKTYEVVAQVMIPAYQAGRTIVTNVRGVDPEYWAAHLRPNTPDRAGSIVVVDDAFFSDETVFPQYDKKNVRDPGQIPPGALVVIDEAYNVFGSERGLVTARMLKWVMMHGHFASDEGVCADVVMVAQDLSLLSPKVRNVAEAVYWVRNLRFIHPRLGRRYRVTAYSSWRMTAAQLLGRKVKSYSDRIFPFYKSTSHSAGRLAVTDAGSSALSPKMLILAGLAVVSVGYGAWGMWGVLGGEDRPAAPLATAMGKPDCAGSGVLLDLSARRALVKGEWRDVEDVPATLDGRVGLDVGDCVFRFGGGAGRGRGPAPDGGGDSGQALRPPRPGLLAGR